MGTSASSLSPLRSAGALAALVLLLRWVWRRRERAALTAGSTANGATSSSSRTVPSKPSRPPPKPKRNSVAAEIFICLDFEWTCDDGEQRQVHSDDVEIIEFSYVIYDAKDNRLAYERQHYCKNERTPITRFCSELTGITDQTLASAGSLADALEALRQDLEDEQLRGRPCCAVAHGSADLELVLPMHCKALGLEVPSVLQTYSDLRLAAQRHVFQQGRIGTRASSLKEICEALGVEMMGSEHCGLDDAWMVLLALQQLLKNRVDLQPVNFQEEMQQFLAGSAQEPRLCIDGLPFNAVSSDVLPWLGKHLDEAVFRLKLWIVLAADGRATGRAVIQFYTWEAAAAALKIFAGGKLISCPAIEGVRRYWERLVLVRPLRGDERLTELRQIPPQGTTAPALAPFPDRVDQLYRGPKYCFAFQEGACRKGEACHFLHQIAPDGAIKPRPRRYQA